MKFLIVKQNEDGAAVAASSAMESALLDVIQELVFQIRQGEIVAESYDKALRALIENGRVVLVPENREVSG